MMYRSGMPDYSSVMRNTVVTTTEMLELIEQDLAESRLLIRARNADDEIASQLVASLQEDNGLLRARVESLEADLAYMHEYSAQSNDTLFKEFEEKILACNGEIERVISQCNDAISDRDDFETQLRQMEVTCAVYSEELEQAKLRLSQSTAHDDNLSRENAHLKEELLRMAHNQYSLQEQLAHITASNAVAQNTIVSTNNHAELASLRGQQGNNDAQSVNRTGTSNLYDDEDIAALLARVKQLEEQNRMLSKQPSNSLDSTSLHTKRNPSVYREAVPVLPSTPVSVPALLVQSSQQPLVQVHHSPRQSSATQASPGFSSPAQGTYNHSPHSKDSIVSGVHIAQSGYIPCSPSAYSTVYAPVEGLQSSGRTGSSDYVKSQEYPVVRVNSAEQVYQQHQHQQQAVPQYFNTTVQQPFSPQPNHVPAANHNLVSSPQHYTQPQHHVALSPAVSPKHNAAAQYQTNYTTLNANSNTHSPAHSPRQLQVHTAAGMTSPQNTTMNSAYNVAASTNSNAINHYSNPATTSGMFERQLASPESDGGNPFELDDSYTQNSGFNFRNQGYPVTAVDNTHSAAHTTIHENAAQVQQNRVHFGPPEYLSEDANSSDLGYPSGDDQNVSKADMSVRVEIDHGNINEVRSEDRLRDLSAEYNDLYNAELYDIIAYSESQLSASQQNFRQRSPQRFYEESHLTGRQTRSDNAYSGAQSSRYTDAPSNVSYMSESDDSGDRNDRFSNPANSAVHINNTNNNINTATTTATQTNSTNDTDNDYPDDFESYTYEDDMSGYLDDHRTGADTNSAGEDRLRTKEEQHNDTVDQGEDNHAYEDGGYNINNNMYAENDNNGQDHGSRSDYEEEDTEFDNVFMYDGSSASALAPVEYDPSMHDDYFNGTIGLDELSRLSL